MPDHDTSAPSSAPDSSTPKAPHQESGIDLSALKSLSFGPDWSATPSTDALARKMGNRGLGKGSDRPGGRDSGGFGNGAPGGRRDRRPPRSPSPSGFAPSGAPGSGGNGPAAGPAQPAGDRPHFASRPPGGFRGGFGQGDRRFTPPPFRPTHEVLFYPDDAAFRALLKAIRSTCRTYELFEVAQLILQKPERFVVVIKAFPRPDNQPVNIYISQPDHLPFESEEEAVAHVFDKHVDQFFTVEQVEVEPPKGSFIGVSKCGITGELLAPPNYHRYQPILREHHARRLSGMSFERFTSRVELVKEPEQVAAWLEKMKKATRYKLKTPVEGAPEFFDNLDTARQFLLGRSKDAIVRSMDTARYSGRALEQFPQGNIRQSVEATLMQQRRFPLETANNLRGRLRRMKFNLYKKGSKGVSFICAVKRKFRDSQTVLAEHVQKLITFIEQHPMIPASKLPQEYLGLPAPVDKKDAEPVAEKEAAAAPAAPATPAAEQPAAAGEAPAAPPAEKVSATTAFLATLTSEQQQQFRELLINLRWLVTEGYVVEYGDGKLFAPPPLPAPKPKAPGEAATPAEGEATASTEEDLIEETASPFPSGDEAGEVSEFSDVLDLPPPPAAPSEPPPPAGTV